jgi:hypothetical protein
VALVGSVLSNGDDIINTLQDGFSFIAREGVDHRRFFSLYRGLRDEVWQLPT